MENNVFKFRNLAKNCDLVLKINYKTDSLLEPTKNVSHQWTLESPWSSILHLAGQRHKEGKLGGTCGLVLSSLLIFCLRKQRTYQVKWPAQCHITGWWQSWNKITKSPSFQVNYPFHSFSFSFFLFFFQTVTEVL